MKSEDHTYQARPWRRVEGPGFPKGSFSAADGMALIPSPKDPHYNSSSTQPIPLSDDSMPSMV